MQRAVASTGTFAKRCTSATREARRRRSARARRGRSARRGRRRPSSPSAATLVVAARRAEGRAAGRGGGSPGRGSTVITSTPARAPRLDLGRGRARVGDDPVELLRPGRTRAGRCDATSSRRRSRTTCSHASAISCLIRTSSGFRSMRPRARLSPRAPRKPLLIRVVAEDVGAEIADERHRRQAQHPAGDEHGDAGGVRERRRDEQAVRDHDELPLRAELEREVVRGRARVERDRLALVRPSRPRRARSRASRSTSRRIRRSKPTSD